MFKRIKDWLSALADLATISTTVGLFIAGVYAAIAIAVGALTAVPWFWVLVIAPMAAAAILISLQKWQEIYGRKSILELANAWKEQDSYLVWVASCLWIGIAPEPKIDEKHKAYPTLQKIKGALASAKIRSLYGDTGAVARVAREELIKLAELRGERPKFLFPD